MSFTRDTTRAQYALQHIVMPTVLGGTRAQWYSTEAGDNPLLRRLDMSAGIDLFIENSDGHISGVSSRIQVIGTGKPYDTFTVRAERDSGAKTEYEKRLQAIQHGYLYPRLMMQAYITNWRGELISAAVANTEDVIRFIEAGNADTRRTTNAEFYVVPWSDLKEAGARVREWRPEPEDEWSLPESARKGVAV